MDKLVHDKISLFHNFSGDEITDGYSGIFSNVPQEERAQIHEKYHFDCLCQACEENWPLKPKLPSNLPKKANYLKSLLKSKNSKNLSEQERFQMLKKTISEAYKDLPRPHMIISQLEDEFYNFLRIMGQ